MPKRRRSPLVHLFSSRRRKVCSLTPKEDIYLSDLFTAPELNLLEIKRAALLKTIAMNTAHWTPRDGSEGTQSGPPRPSGDAERPTRALSPDGDSTAYRASKRRATGQEGYQQGYSQGYPQGGQELPVQEYGQALQPYAGPPPGAYRMAPGDAMAAIFHQLPAAQQMMLLQAMNIIRPQSSYSVGGHPPLSYSQGAVGPLSGYPNLGMPQTPEMQPGTAGFEGPIHGPSSHPFPSITGVPYATASSFEQGSHSHPGLPPNNLSSSASLSSGVNSCNQTLFSGQGSQVTGHETSVASADMPEPSSSKSSKPAPSTSASGSGRPGRPRTKSKSNNKPWEIRELDLVLRCILGPNALPGLLDVAMRTTRSPRSDRTLKTEWYMVEDKVFKNERSATSIVLRWWDLFNIYSDLMLHLTAFDLEDATTAQLVEKIQALVRELGDGGALGKMPADQYGAWTEDPENGWFAMLHRRFPVVPVLPLVKEPLHPVPPPPPPVSSQGKRQTGKQSRSKGSVPSRLSSSFVPTPSQPATGTGTGSIIGSAPAASQQSGQWVLPLVTSESIPGPALMEAVRDNNEVSDAVADATSAKAYYCYGQGLLRRIDCLERVTDILIKADMRRSVRALQTLESPGISDATRDAADAVLREEVKKQPDPIKVEDILARLENPKRRG